MPAHAERLGDEHRGPLPRAAALSGEPRHGPRVQHVVAIEPGAPDAVARRPVLEGLGDMVLVEPGAEGDLVVLDHEDSGEDRKSTRLNSSHSQISYAVFCLKKKN